MLSADTSADTKPITLNCYVIIYRRVQMMYRTY